MHTHTHIVALVALASTVTAVSLSDFPPYLSSLPIPCEVVYKQPIIGCSATDFHPAGRACSAGCVGALQLMEPVVKSACGNSNIGGNNVIAAFLAGAGPQSICGNANLFSNTVTASTTSAASKTKSIAATSTTSSASTQSTESLSTTISSATTETVIPAPATTTSTDLLVDTSSVPSATSSASSTTTFPANSGLNDDGSGGGSPFDTPGNMASAADVVACPSSITFLTAIILLFLGLR